MNKIKEPLWESKRHTPLTGWAIWKNLNTSESVSQRIVNLTGYQARLYVSKMLGESPQDIIMTDYMPLSWTDE